jgi:hypothetical protein
MKAKVILAIVAVVAAIGLAATTIATSNLAYADTQFHQNNIGNHAGTSTNCGTVTGCNTQGTIGRWS